MWRTRVRALILPILGIILFGGVIVATLPQRVSTLKSTYQLYALPPLSGLDKNIVNILLLGHKPIYDDFLSIFLLQTLLQEQIVFEAEPLMGQIRAVIKHEPRLESTYMLACFIMLNQAKRPEFCREINDAGLRAFPMSWRLLMTQAFVEYSAMGQPAQAASFFTLAAQLPNAPPYVAKVAKKLLETRELTDTDIEESMKIMGDTEANAQFKQLLESIQKNKKPKNPESPDSSTAPEGPREGEGEGNAEADVKANESQEVPSSIDNPEER